MNTPLSRLQHDLSLAPGIPDSYRLFGEGPTVSTYGDLREVAGRAAGLVEVPREPTEAMLDAAIDASPMWAVAFDYRREDKVAMSKLPLREGQSLSTEECAVIYRAMLAAFSAVPLSQGTETKAAYTQGWNDRECDFLAGAARIMPHQDVSGAADLFAENAKKSPDVTELVEALKGDAIGWAVMDLRYDEPTINTGALSRRFERTLASFQSRQEEGG